jgi:hypothetical protein
MLNEELTYRHIQRALKRRGFKANGSHKTLIKRFKAEIIDQRFLQNDIKSNSNRLKQFYHRLCSENFTNIESFHYLTLSFNMRKWVRRFLEEGTYFYS